MSNNHPKRAISIRLAPEILDWFRRDSPSGYQSRIHRVLADHVRTQQRIAERKAGRAQELFRVYYARCFWHFDRSLVITPENMQLVIEGLRKYGGREGLSLAEELCH